MTTSFIFQLHLLLGYVLWLLFCAAYGWPWQFSLDHATAHRIIAALHSNRIFDPAFNVIGAADILIDYAHGIQFGLPEIAGQLGAAYAIPVIYVPLLMITHVTALVLAMRHRRAWQAEANVKA